jgi:uncharacterized damage-inducible protein DinB
MKKFFLAVFLFCTLHAVANDDSLKIQLIKDWQRAQAYTQQYMDAMPADKYSFRPNDSIRTFAQQLLHLAQGNVGLVSNGTGAAPLIWAGRNLEKSAAANSKDSVVFYVNASYDYCIAALKAMDAAKFDEKVTRGTLTESRFSWINKAFEHQTHHRGQTTIYIRLLGIKPPNEMLF